MNVTIHAIHFEISKQLEAHTNKKLAKLKKLSDEMLSIDVFFKVLKPESAENKEAEIKISIPNHEFFAAKTSNTFEEAIDTASEAVEKQIIKHKEKIREK